MTMLKLMQLARDNASTSKPLRAESAGREATIYLHGVIGGYWGDIDETDFATTVAQLDVDTIHLRIDSPGGDVFAARSMMTAISQHKAKVVGHVDGLAASAATGICMSCDEVEISQGARFMIHNAWTVAIGNKADLRETADMLDTVDAGLAQDYVTRTGKTEAQVKQWMDEETWFSADDAVASGFADRTVAVVKKRASNTWNLAAYKNAPKADEPAALTGAAMAEHRNSLERRFALLQHAPA